MSAPESAPEIAEPARIWRAQVVALAMLALIVAAMLFARNEAVGRADAMRRAQVAAAGQEAAIQRIALTVAAMRADDGDGDRQGDGGGDRGGDGVAAARARLAEALLEFETVHEALATGDPAVGLDGRLPGRIEPLFHDRPVRLDARARAFARAARRVLTAAGEERRHAAQEVLRAADASLRLAYSDARRAFGDEAARIAVRAGRIALIGGAGVAVVIALIMATVLRRGARSMRGAAAALTAARGAAGRAESGRRAAAEEALRFVDRVRRRSDASLGRAGDGLALLSRTPMTEAQRRIVGGVADELARHRTGLAELSDAARAEAGVAPPLRLPVDLPRLLSEAVARRGADAERAGAALSGPRGGPLTAGALGDPRRLADTLDAVLRRAVRVSAGGRALLSAHVEPGPSDDAIAFIAAVRDSGPSLTDVEREQLFVLPEGGAPGAFRDAGALVAARVNCRIMHGWIEAVPNARGGGVEVRFGVPLLTGDEGAAAPAPLDRRRAAAGDGEETAERGGAGAGAAAAETDGCEGQEESRAAPGAGQRAAGAR